MVDIATALFHLWTVRGLHREVNAWAASLLHHDDPQARLRSAITAGRAAGRPLPDADRLTWLCLLRVNAGINGSPRTGALARRVLHLLLAERPAEISPSRRILANALPTVHRLRPGSSSGSTEELIACPDPYVRGLGLFLRATMWGAGGTSADSVAADAEQAYRSFEQAGDHWGMAMAAQTVGHSVSARGGGRGRGVAARSVRHMELVGAAQDARSIGVLLDVQQALAGEDGALDRLHEVTRSPQVEDMDVAQAYLGLAHVAWEGDDVADAVRYAEAATAMIQGDAIHAPQARILFRVAAAVVHLRSAGTPGIDERTALPRAVELLELARVEAQSMAGHARLRPVRPGCRRAGRLPGRRRHGARAVGAGRAARREPGAAVPAPPRRPARAHAR